MIVIDQLIKSVRASVVYNSDMQVAPRCILWTDKDRQWESIIPRVQTEVPELFVLGEYSPELNRGPGIWLRCVIAKQIEEIDLDGKTPIIYLPGINRQDLKEVDTCSDEIKPIIELQFSGVIWSQQNSKDWTILAFLMNEQDGLGLDVAQDNDTKNAIQRSLYKLIDEDVKLIEGKKIDKDYFNTLLTGGDPTKDLLLWLDKEDTFVKSRDENEWLAFVEVCKSQLGFNPIKDGVLVAATKLAEKHGPWEVIWQRFCEAPTRYPNIPSQIRKGTMPPVELFSDVETHGSWPQWNEKEEDLLRAKFLEIKKYPAHEAREKLLAAYKPHLKRKDLVWAELGQSPLAVAGAYLAILAHLTKSNLAAGEIKDLTDGYVTWGWKVDDAVLNALSSITKSEDYEAVTTVIRSIYKPWIEDSALHLQKVVSENGYPGLAVNRDISSLADKGTCLLFVDGLRFDIAQRLKRILESYDVDIDEVPTWSALPSVTATGKPAVTPVSSLIKCEVIKSDFEPINSYQLKKLLTDNGWDVLDKNEYGDPNGLAWCEFGDIDHEGHSRGYKLVNHIDSLLEEITEKISYLLKTGWKKIKIVTDHGWLLLPDSLPKIELPATLADSKWGRCAAIKKAADSEETLYPWYWNPEESFALATGISCYKNGLDYTHGGLSLQECLTLELTVNNKVSLGSKAELNIKSVTWNGLRCKVLIDGNYTDTILDIRTHPGDSSTSVVTSQKNIKSDGTASAIIENEDLEGTSGVIVIIKKNGELLKQLPIIIGGEN